MNLQFLGHIVEFRGGFLGDGGESHCKIIDLITGSKLFRYPPPAIQHSTLTGKLNLNLESTRLQKMHEIGLTETNEIFKCSTLFYAAYLFV